MLQKPTCSDLKPSKLPVQESVFYKLITHHYQSTCIICPFRLLENSAKKVMLCTMTSQKIHLTVCHLPYSEWFLLYLPSHTTALLLIGNRFCSAVPYLQNLYLKLNPNWWRMVSMSCTSSSQWLQLNSGLGTLQLRASRIPLFLLQLLPWWGSSKRTSPGGQGKILAHLTPS